MEKLFEKNSFYVFFLMFNDLWKWYGNGTASVYGCTSGAIRGA